MTWEDHLPKSLGDLYEIYDYRHAAALLATEFPQEFSELCEAFMAFRISVADIITPGGNESTIPKKISALLRPKGWREEQLKAELVVDGNSIQADTHKVDYLKGRVAFDLEWNSKDQTFDRDLFAFRSFHEFNKISVGVLMTRSANLNDVFGSLGKDIKQKYGASTTWMGKLIPRLNAGRAGGCPLLILGITPNLILDWKEGPVDEHE